MRGNSEGEGGIVYNLMFREGGRKREKESTRMGGEGGGRGGGGGKIWEGRGGGGGGGGRDGGERGGGGGETGREGGEDVGEGGRKGMRGGEGEGQGKGEEGRKRGGRGEGEEKAYHLLTRLTRTLDSFRDNSSTPYVSHGAQIRGGAPRCSGKAVRRGTCAPPIPDTHDQSAYAGEAGPSG